MLYPELPLSLRIIIIKRIIFIIIYYCYAIDYAFTLLMRDITTLFSPHYRRHYHLFSYYYAITIIDYAEFSRLFSPLRFRR